MFDKIIDYINELNETLLYGEDISEEEVEHFVGMVALLYAIANVDEIVKSELQVISLYKFNISRGLDRLDKKHLHDLFYNHLEKLDEIEKIKETIKLSAALKYFPITENGLSENMKNTLQSLSTEMMNADGTISQEEENLKSRINLYLEKGYEVIKDIEHMEKMEDIKNKAT